MYHAYGGESGEGPDEFDEEYDAICDEYAMDDTLDSLTRLERYHTSDFSLQRLVLVRELADTAKEAGYQGTTQRMLPLLGNFVADSEPAVRQTFVQQLFPLAKFLMENGHEQGYHELINTFLPYTFELLVDKNVEVGSTAINELIKLADLVKPEQVEAQLLNVVVTLAHDERAEDYRVVAAQLFNELAPRFGEKLCRETVVQEVVVLSEDMSFSVRKTVASNLGKLAKVIGKDLSLQKLLPIYITLSKDDIWAVRKACAESICQLSEGIHPESSALVEVFERFTEDVSRWVRVAAYQQLGPFIATCPPGDVSAQLVKSFTAMAAQGESGTDSDLAEYCAYNFPAVVLALGKERWGELEDAYLTLTKDVQWKVRKSLAHSLHEIARMVGQEITSKTLVQAFDLFLHDLDEVKIGVLRNIAEFMQVLGPAERDKYINVVCQLPAEMDNWRLRNILAVNLGKLSQLVSPAVCKRTITEVATKLLEDTVAEVRTSSVRSVGTVLRRLCQGDQADRADFLAYLIGLKSSPNYQFRELFVHVTQELAEQDAVDSSVQIFESDFLDLLLQLCSDRVPNVRVTLARMFSRSVRDNEKYRNLPQVKQMKEKLAADSDKEVQYLVTAIHAKPAA